MSTDVVHAAFDSKILKNAVVMCQPHAQCNVSMKMASS